QSGEIRIRSSVWPVPIEPDRVLMKINLADSVRGTLKLHYVARSGFGQSAVVIGGRAGCGRQKKRNPSHNAHVSLICQLLEELEIHAVLAHGPDVAFQAGPNLLSCGALHAASSLSSAFASLRSRVSNPSVNQL